MDSAQANLLTEEIVRKAILGASIATDPELLEVISKMVDCGSNANWERANGPYRRTMDSSRTVIAKAEQASGRQRQTESGQSSHSEWDLMGHANRSTLA